MESIPKHADGRLRRRIAFVFFDEFEFLDVFGPMEFFSVAQRVFEDNYRQSEAGYVIDAINCHPGSSAGASLRGNGGPPCVSVPQTAEFYLENVLKPGERIDILLVPGGKGTRTLVLAQDEVFLGQLRRLCERSTIVASVCTGSALLAKAGVLDGRKATSNKLAFRWASSQSDKVRWQPKARWVVDGKYWTSSGVAAGMDMALALIAHDFGESFAEKIAHRVEYVWNKDPSHDLFEAKL